MTLRDLMGNGAPEVEVSGLAYSSTSVTPGTLFFCVPGLQGRRPRLRSRRRRARAPPRWSSQRPLGLGVPEVVVDDVRAAMGPAAARFHGDPTATLRVVGVTGTNGKTTTAFLIRELLEAAGIQTGLLGTVTSIVGGHARSRSSAPPRKRVDLQATFRAHARRAATAPCAMEVSSHALDCSRVAGIHFAVRVLTNLTQDHLDFHPTMEDYYAGQEAAVHAAGRRRRSSTSTTRTAAAWRARSTSSRRPTRSSATPTSARATCVRHERVALHLRDARRRVRADHPAAGPLQRAERARGGRRGARARRADGRRSPPRWREAGRVPGRFEPIDEGQELRACWSTTRTRPTRSTTCCAPRARSRAAGCTWCSAPAATATAPSGR